MKTNASSSASVFKWLLGLTASLFMVAGFTQLYQHFFGTAGSKKIQLAARADLDVLLMAERSFRDRHGFYTTDLASLAIDPKHVYYKFGFTRAIASEEVKAEVPGHDGTVMDLDLLLGKKPGMKLFFSEQTRADQIHIGDHAALCPDCTATATAFKALGIANLDEDPEVDAWTVDQNGNYEHIRDDLKP